MSKLVSHIKQESGLKTSSAAYCGCLMDMVKEATCMLLPPGAGHQ